MKNLSKCIVAVATGVALGGTLGILFAPEKGEKTRRDISKKGKKLLRKMNDQMGKEKLTELKKEFEEQLDKINEKIKNFVNVD